MIARSLWLLLALALGFGVPFWAFGISGLPFVPALSLSILGLLAAAIVVRRSRAPRD